MSFTSVFISVFISISYTGLLIQRVEAHKVLAPPPTDQTHQLIFLLGTALDTLGQYKWRHCGDF